MGLPTWKFHNTIIGNSDKLLRMKKLHLELFCNENSLSPPASHIMGYNELSNDD